MATMALPIRTFSAGVEGTAATLTIAGSRYLRVYTGDIRRTRERLGPDCQSHERDSGRSQWATEGIGKNLRA